MGAILYVDGVPILTAEDMDVSDDLTVGDDASITDDLTVGGKITLTGGDTIDTTANGNITLLPNGTGITIIGDAGSTSHSLTANDDLFVSGKFEVDGYAYFDHSLTMAVGAPLGWAGATSGLIQYVGSQTPDAFIVGVGSDSNGLLIMQRADIGTDMGHALVTDPTVYTHSADATETTEFSTLAWDEFSIGAGKGAYFGIKTMTEEVTVAVGQGAGGVNTAGNLAPASSLILGVTARVTDAPGGGATTIDIGVTGGDADAFVDGMATALDTTADTPTDGNAGAQMPIANGAATTLTITTDANVTVDDMKVRIAVCYLEFTAPTS